MSGNEVFRVRRRTLWKRLRGRTLLTLDRHGVTRHSDWIFLAWSEVSEVLITVGPDGDRSVEFIAAGLGGELIVRARDLDVELEDLLSAVHRFTGAPINQRYSPAT